MITACARCRRPIDTEQDSYATRMAHPGPVYCSGVCATWAAEHEPCQHGSTAAGKTWPDPGTGRTACCGTPIADGADGRPPWCSCCSATVVGPA